MVGRLTGRRYSDRPQLVLIGGMLDPKPKTTQWQLEYVTAADLLPRDHQRPSSLWLACTTAVVLAQLL